MPGAREPQRAEGQKWEEALQEAMVREVGATLAGIRPEPVVLQGFGLDIAVFMERGGLTTVRFLELKAYSGQRPRSVQVCKGERYQQRLIACTPQQLAMQDRLIRWIVWDTTRQDGEARYAFVTSADIRHAWRGTVRGDKEHNINIDKLTGWIDWPTLLVELRAFLLD